MRKAYDEVLKDQFEFLLVTDQQILSGEDERQRTIENNLLEMIQDPDVQKRVRDRFARCSSGELPAQRRSHPQSHHLRMHSRAVSVAIRCCHFLKTPRRFRRRGEVGRAQGRDREDSEQN